MKRPYDTVAAFETALKHKLTARVGPGRTYADLRKHVAFDRLLARLDAVAPDDWLLKGGVALEYRLGHARATKDVDLSAKLFDVERMAQTLSDAAEIELNDYFALRIAGRTKPADEVQTYRFAVDVLLENGKLFDELKVDVGFADPWLGGAEELEGPDLLRFAGIPAAKVRAIPARQHPGKRCARCSRRAARTRCLRTSHRLPRRGTCPMRSSPAALRFRVPRRKPTNTSRMRSGRCSLRHRALGHEAASFAVWSDDRDIWVRVACTVHIDCRSLT